MLICMFVRNAVQVVAQDRSVGGEGLSFNGMELEGGGLEHGLGREGVDMRSSWTQCTERSYIGRRERIGDSED